MSNNCLVTKLKGSVQNDDLPRFNEILLDYKGTNNANETTSVLMLGLDSGAESNITIKSARNMHLTTPEGVIKTEYTLNPGGFVALHAIKSEVGSSPISNFIEICDGSIYDICKISFGEFNFTKAKANLDSLLRYSKLYALGYELDDTLHELPSMYKSEILECIVIKVDNRDNPDYNLDISNLEGFDSLKFIIIVETANVNPIVRSIPEGTEYIKGIRFKNTLTNAPASMKGFTTTFINTLVCSGSLESFVEKARANGRTSGYLMMPESTYTKTNGVTFNNTPFKDYVAATPPPAVTVGNNSYYILTWTSNSITWGTTAPADAVDFKDIYSVYSYQKQQS